MTKKSSPIPKQMTALTDNGESMYEVAMIISKRARQIANKRHEEFNDKLAQLPATEDNLEEINENKEQIALSKYYEKETKPITIATDEFLKRKIMYRYPEIEEETYA